MSEETLVPVRKPRVNYDLNYDVFQLLKDEPFYACISRHISKKASMSIPTAGVRVNERGYFELIYNPKFILSLNPDQRRGLLKHEFLHIIWEHVTSRKKEEDQHHFWNLATDLAINSWIPHEELPEGGCVPGEGPFSTFPRKLMSEAYFLRILQEKEKFSQVGNMGDHSQWGQNMENLSNEAKDIMKRMVAKRARDLMEEAAKESAERGWGSVPSELQKQILAALQNFVDWKGVLRYFIKTSQRGEKRGTMRRLNRRFPYQHPGKKTVRHAKLLIGVDMSGSVSDKLLQMFFAELIALSKFATFTVAPFDTEVLTELVYEWKRGTIPNLERVKCGGTCFNCITDFANEGHYDGLIILTDMQAPAPGPCKVQRLWLTDEENFERPYFATNEQVVPIR